MTAAGETTLSPTDDAGPADARLPLGDEFPAVSQEQWLQLAAKALRRDFAPGDDAAAVVATLRSTTYDGIVIEPLYSPDTTTQHRPGHAADGLPGFAPFVRGRTAAGTRDGGWDVRQVVDAANPQSVAVDELERGATSLWLRLTGLATIDDTTLGAALEGVYLDLTSVTLDAGDRWAAAADALTAVWASRGIADDAASASIGADPVGDHASSGGTTDVEAELVAVADLAKRLAGKHPGVRAITIDATRYHEAGAADGQELGYGIAAAVATLRALLDAGMDTAAAFAQIELRFAATADQFSTIAKFRAARRLWARVAEVAGDAAAAGATPIHAVTSAAMMSRHDPWVNVLRGTIACFGAGVGGADTVTVLPYDTALDPLGSELGRRIARNTQSILSKESNLSRVIDPSGGSWYVESLTDQLAATAWARFQGLERAGGIVAAIGAGTLAADIDEVWQARRRNLVTRRDPLTGVSEFPNVAEPVPPPRARVGSPGANALPRHRYAEPFEDVRDRVDAAVTAGADRPTVFLANVSTPAAFTARASFAKNLFEIGGIVAISGEGSDDPAEVARQFTSSGATVACVCSTDAVYAQIGAPVVTALREAGASAVYLAGRPKQAVDALVAAGVDTFVTAGADVEQILSDLLTRLDVS